MDEWEQFESGSYDGGYDDLSIGGESDVDNNLDWQDSLGTEGDLADQWLASVGESEFNDPDSHLVGVDTDAAILNARLRSTGLPVTYENTIGDIPEYMRPSAVTHYDLSGVDPQFRNIENLTQGSIQRGITSTINVGDITQRQQSQFEKIVANAQKNEASSIDALPAITGHASNLTREDYLIGGRNIGGGLDSRGNYQAGVLDDLANRYLKEGAGVEMQRSLARHLAIQIPRTSRGMQASFGGNVPVSHMDALPTPMQLPDRFQGMLKQTLNMAGGAYNPDYRESREYRFASKSDQASMDWFNRPSSMATLTGAPYVGMHKSQEQLAKLDPIQRSTLEAQKDIEADFKGFLSLAGLAKDIKGRKLSTDNSQGTATNFIRPVVGADYFSPMDELARIGLMDSEGLIGTGETGNEGAMSPLGYYKDRITEVFGENVEVGEDLFKALDEGWTGEAINKTPEKTTKDLLKANVAKRSADALKEFGEGYYYEDLNKYPTVKEAIKAAAARVSNPSNTRNTFEDITNTRQYEEAIKAEARPIESKARAEERALAQANVEAALKARGLNISSAEQGSAEWLANRTGILTSTGVGTSMAESPYGDTWLGHIKSAINEKANPEVAARRSNPMFDAGTRGEELGKKWFEDKFDKNIVDLGLITDPNKPNQGTSLDGVVTGRDGTVGANLELVEFKWGTTRFPPRDAAKKHQQQLQHQMYMTGAESVNLVTGYDPNAGTLRAGIEDGFQFANEPVFRDPDWAKNNAAFIQARANEKANAVGSGSTENLKEAYLEALKERYPNESDKGLTKEEREAKKASEREAKQQAQEDRAEDKEFKQDFKRVSSFLSKGISGGINLQSTGDMLSSFGGKFGMIGQAASALVGVGTAAYDATRAANELVGQAADAGTDTQGFLASNVALRSMSFSDSQAASFTQNTYSQQAMASVGEFDPLVKRLTAYRGLVSMEDLQNLTPEALTTKLRSLAESGQITKQQLAGMALMAGDVGIARSFQDEDTRKGIVGDAEARRLAGLKTEDELRSSIGSLNVSAVSLNAADAAKESALNIAADNRVGGQLSRNIRQGLNEIREEPWYETAFDMATYAPRKTGQALGIGWDKLFGDESASNVVGDTTAGKKSTIESNIHVTVENKQTTTTLEQSVNGKPEEVKRSIVREE